MCEMKSWTVHLPNGSTLTVEAQECVIDEGSSKGRLEFRNGKEDYRAVFAVGAWTAFVKNTKPSDD